MIDARQISRRTVLRGLGTAMALPWLEAMAPAAPRRGPAGAAAVPNRMAFLYVPNGIHMADWTPDGGGRRLRAARTSSSRSSRVQGRPARPDRPDADKAQANGDGAGDHARAAGRVPHRRASPRKTDGADIRAGVSVDQVAASKVGEQTRLPVARARLERRRAGRQLRLRLQLRLLVEHLLAVADDADGQGDQPAAGLRAALRQRRPTGRPRPRQARPVQAEHPRLRPEDAGRLQATARRRPTGASSTST